jgi:drug/metabolite transporter (DMT)-like permease
MMACQAFVKPASTAVVEGLAMAAIALALGASLAWGASDFLAGIKSRELAVIWVLLVSQATGLVLVTVAALVAGDPLPSLHAMGWAAAAGVAELIGFAAFYRALAVGAMAIVAPVSATAAIVPLVVGAAGGQVPTIVQALGMALALGGAALASTEPGRRTAAGVGLAISAALAFGVFFVGIDTAADDGALWAVSFSRIAAVGIVVVAVVVLRPPPIARAAYVPLAAVGGLDIGANVMFAIALTVGTAGLVSVLGSLYPLATVVLARAILREHVSGQQRTGAAAALAGIALVSLA